MSAIPTFRANEYVWDRVRKGPAVVVGIAGDDRYTVAEIVLPARKLGRVALRRTEDLCRYVRLLVPEDEIEALDVTLGGNMSVIHPKQLGDALGRFIGRLRTAKEDRGIVRAR